MAKRGKVLGAPPAEAPASPGSDAVQAAPPSDVAVAAATAATAAGTGPGRHAQDPSPGPAAGAADPVAPSPRSSPERPVRRQARTRAGAPRAAAARPAGGRPVAGRPAGRRTGLPTLPDASVTDELRATLDDLRRVLDDVSTAPTPPRRRRRRRGLLLAGGALAAVLVVSGVSAVAGWGPFGDDAPSVTAEETGRPSATSPAAAPSAVTAPETQVSLPPLRPWPGGSSAAPAQLPAQGPGIDAPGTALVATVLPDDTLEVYERVRLAEPADTVALAVPVLTTVQGLSVKITPTVDDLQVSVDGRVVRAVEQGPGRWIALPPRGARAVDVELRYRVSGEVLRTGQTAPGRVLVALAPLSAVGSDAAGVQASLIGGQVVGMVCPSAPVSTQLCGTSDAEGRWTAVLPDEAAAPLVLVTADLD